MLGPLYFVLKVIAVLFLFLWVRASVPRPRYDGLRCRNGFKCLLQGRGRDH
jgi:NADH-quinone oxidoreductase subunit H